MTTEYNEYTMKLANQWQISTGNDQSACLSKNVINLEENQ